MHVHRSKVAHKRAVFLLAKELAAALADVTNPDLEAHRTHRVLVKHDRHLALLDARDTHLNGNPHGEAS